MSSAALFANPLSLEDILEFSRVQIYGLELLASEVLAALESTDVVTYPEFRGLSQEMILDRFDFFRNEVEWNGILIMLSAIEATIRLDYSDKRRKVRRFRSLYSTFGSRTALEDLIDAWQEERSSERDLFGMYKDALRVRNWLAHGRYFYHDVRRHRYSIEYIYELGVQIRNILS